MVLRHCLLGYGTSGIIGLAVASWVNPLLGVLIFWLGGGALSVGWIYWVYRRDCAAGAGSSHGFASTLSAQSMQSGVKPGG